MKYLFEELKRFEKYELKFRNRFKIDSEKIIKNRRENKQIQKAERFKTKNKIQIQSLSQL